MRTPERVLVRATNWVGDVVMSTPALAGIRKSFPGARISLLVRPQLGELLLGNPAVDEIIHIDKKGIHAGPTGLSSLVGELRKRRFTKAILLQNAFEAAFIAFLARVPERMGYATDGRGVLLTRAVKVAGETKRKHQVFYYLDLLAALGLEHDDYMPKLYVDADEVEAAARTLAAHGVGRDSLVVGINPGAQYGAAKRWHPERFGYVADGLAREFGAKAVIFGGPGDVDTARTVQASMKEEAVNLAGRTSMREFMALVRRCGLFITNDTGPMHVSAALGVPTLAVFGSTDPVATGPFGERHAYVRELVNCGPCLKRTCPLEHFECMERMSPGKVLSKAKGMIGVAVG